MDEGRHIFSLPPVMEPLVLQVPRVRSTPCFSHMLTAGFLISNASDQKICFSHK